MHKIIRLAVAQAPQTADLGENLRTIGRFVDLAARAKSELLLFPECALVGYGPRYHESSAGFDPDAVEAAIDEVRDLARATKMAILLGTVLPQEGGWTNSALLIAPTGRAARYDKLHLYGSETEFHRAGRAMPKVVKAAGAKIGMQICFDVRFPETFRRLALAGAQMIVVPSFIHGARDMWKGPVIEGHLRSRAAENGRFIIFANAAGDDQNVPSMIVNPRGEVMVACPRAKPQLLHASLDLGMVSNDMLRCRRRDLYGVAVREEG